MKQTLSEKRVDTGSRLFPSGKYSYDEEDIKQFIKEILEEMAKEFLNKRMKNGNLVKWHGVDIQTITEQIIKQKAGDLE